MEELFTGGSMSEAETDRGRILRCAGRPRGGPGVGGPLAVVTESVYGVLSKTEPQEGMAPPEGAVGEDEALRGRLTYGPRFPGVRISASASIAGSRPSSQSSDDSGAGTSTGIQIRSSPG